jgi:hypothetical protein
MHRLNHCFHSLKTYCDLSPDLRMRQQVIQAMQSRTCLTLDAWFEAFCQPQKIAFPIAQFVYTHLPHYSGLETGRMWLSDRLNEDLHWPLICWFDWELSLCDDFCQCFGIDISDRLDELEGTTIGELVHFLDRQWVDWRGGQVGI